MFKTLMLAAATSALLATSATAQAPADDTTCFANSMFGYNEVARMGIPVPDDPGPVEYAKALLSVYANADPAVAAALVFDLQKMTIDGKLDAIRLSTACSAHAAAMIRRRTEELRRDLDQ